MLILPNHDEIPLGGLERVMSFEEEDFFRHNKITAAEIKKGRERVDITEDIVDKIIGLGHEEYGVIVVNLIPEEFRDASHFMKHGTLLTPYRGTKQQIIEMAKTPFDSIRETYESSRATRIVGHSIKPVYGSDKIERSIPLNELFEGAIYALWLINNPNLRIIMKRFGSPERAKRSVLDGAEYDFRAVSRTSTGGKKDPNYPGTYKVVLKNVPFEDIPHRFATASLISTETPACLNRRYRDLRFNRKDDTESSKRSYQCAHGIGSYHVVALSSLLADGNVVPAEMSPFPIPTQDGLNFFRLLKEKCLVQYIVDGKKQSPKTLTDGDLCIMLKGAINKKGFDRMLHSNAYRLPYLRL